VRDPRLKLLLWVPDTVDDDDTEHETAAEDAALTDDVEGVAFNASFLASAASTKVVVIVVRVTDVATMTTSHDFTKADARDDTSRYAAVVSSSAVLGHIVHSLLISDILA
jgi:hypothetical protein